MIVRDTGPGSLYTHSILNVVYQTYQEIEHEYGSIVNLTAEEIVAKLIQRRLNERVREKLLSD